MTAHNTAPILVIAQLKASMDTLLNILFYSAPIVLILLILNGFKMPKSDSSQIADPVAEADVYIAYGRKAQAIEILKTAIKHDPSHRDIQAKLEMLEMKQ